MVVLNPFPGRRINSDFWPSFWELMVGWMSNYRTKSRNSIFWLRKSRWQNSYEDEDWVQPGKSSTVSRTTILEYLTFWWVKDVAAVVSSRWWQALGINCWRVNFFVWFSNELCNEDSARLEWSIGRDHSVNWNLQVRLWFSFRKFVMAMNEKFEVNHLELFSHTG